MYILPIILPPALMIWPSTESDTPGKSLCQTIKKVLLLASMGKAHKALIPVTAKNIDHAGLGLTIGIKPHGRYIQMRGNVLKIKLIHIIAVALKGDKVFILLRQHTGYGLSSVRRAHQPG